MIKFILFIAAVFTAALIVGLKLADAARPHHTVAYCRYVAREAAAYRRADWAAQDGLQEPRTLAGYHAGRRINSCPRARQQLVNWRTRFSRAHTLLLGLNQDIPAAILHYFGPELGPGAIVVAHCESGTGLTRAEIPAALNASNGLYHGIFQMGDPGNWEVNTYGVWRGQVRYATVVDQVAAAARMQQARSWSVWACRPDGSVAY
jgi:hypothetical protein